MAVAEQEQMHYNFSSKYLGGAGRISFKDWREGSKTAEKAVAGTATTSRQLLTYWESETQKYETLSG